MAYNPYQVAQSQTGLMEALLGAEQKKKTMKSATSAQMSKMETDFEKQLRGAQQAAEAQLRKKKKKGIFGKIAGLAAGFAGPIAGPILSGLMSMYDMKGQSKFAEKQAKRAKGAALGLDFDRYGKTFLGKKALDYKAGQESAFDKMISETDVGFGDLLTTGLGAGLTSMAMGKATKGIKGKIGDIKAEKALLKGAKEGVAKTDISKLTESLKGETPSLTKTDILDYTEGGGKDPSMVGGFETADILDDLNISDPKQLENLLRVSEGAKQYGHGEGTFKRLFGKDSPFQKTGQIGLEDEQTSLMANLLPMLMQSGFLE